MTDEDHLKNIYRLYIYRRGARSAIIEREIGCEGIAQISQDDRYNEPHSYIALFQGSFSPLIVQLYQRLMRSMRGKQIEECADEFAGLSFFKATVMKALAYYQADHETQLAKFANKFDRLDEPSVRQKLYELAQAEPTRL